jgi:hypothetical protein
MRSLPILLLLAARVVFAQEEAIDIPPPEEKKLEWNGNLDAKYTLFHSAQESPLYQLQFYNAGKLSSYLSQYRIEPYLNADYRTKDLGFHLKTHATYFSDDEATFDLFEAYGSFNSSFNSTIQFGKRVYSWGKGYAFNPVGYVNPFKDPENPELAQAGLLSANFEYIKSFSSAALQTFSFLFVLIPPPPKFNRRYDEAENTDVALKTYFLLWDTDIDLMGYYSQAKPKRLGLDFSRNLTGNFEVHGEVSYSKNAQRYLIDNGGLRLQEDDQFSYLFGLRYLHASNTTVIAEYYHHGLGLNKNEYEEYAGFLANGARSGSAAIVQNTLGVSQQYFRGSTLMQNYLYMKIIKPEPFDWLYFTPSLYTIHNLHDNSFLLATTLSYEPVTNFEFIFWPTFLLGGNSTEFGSKLLQQRVELWMRVYF